MRDTLDGSFLSTDISVITVISEDDKNLPLAVERFVPHWGVNRSVSQIHACSFLSERPMTADEIADTLTLARSNVSNSTKELLAWNLIQVFRSAATGASIFRRNRCLGSVPAYRRREGAPDRPGRCCVAELRY